MSLESVSTGVPETASIKLPGMMAMKPEPLSDSSTSGGPCSTNNPCSAVTAVAADSSATGSHRSW
jgi:hypothetical protein